MSQSEEYAVVVRDLYKSFRLPHEQSSGLKQSLVNLFRQPSKRVKGYETQHVLEDISFEIKKGEFFGIVGRNGSGKSTLLKLLAGIYVPDKGLVQVNGSLTPFIELGVGFNPELTGRENVFLNGALLGFSKSEMGRMYADIVEFAELEKFMDQKLKNYSSGMQVRLAFSIAIRAQSDILLIDEVLAVGDSEFQQKCFRYFEKLKQEHRTIILVSHDMDSIRRFCDAGILLHRGRVAKTGDIEEITSEYMMLNKPKTDEFISNSQTLLGKVTHYINAHDLVIEVEHHAKSLGNLQKNNLITGISITTMDGRHIAGINDSQNKSNSVEKKRCTIDLTNLNQGEYLYSVSLYTQNYELVDHRNNAGAFVVAGSRRKDADGIVKLDFEWR